VQVLDAVARTLGLDPVERAHLYRLAEIPAAAPAPAVGEPWLASLEPDMRGILDQLAPLPACVLNARYDVLAWNAPYAVLWRRTLSAPPGQRNVLWQSFLIPSAAARTPATGRRSCGTWSRHSAPPSAGTSGSRTGQT
jgi:hypothetical protein